MIDIMYDKPSSLILIVFDMTMVTRNGPMATAKVSIVTHLPFVRLRLSGLFVDCYVHNYLGRRSVNGVSIDQSIVCVAFVPP